MLWGPECPFQSQQNPQTSQIPFWKQAVDGCPSPANAGDRTASHGLQGPSAVAITVSSKTKLVIKCFKKKKKRWGERRGERREERRDETLLLPKELSFKEIPGGWGWGCPSPKPGLKTSCKWYLGQNKNYQPHPSGTSEDSSSKNPVTDTILSEDVLIFVI